MKLEDGNMKKDIGSVLGLYPTPLVVAGVMVDGKPNWMLAGHVGIIGHDRIMVSMAKIHYSNQGVKATKAMTVNIVSEELLPAASYVGKVSGSKTDKSGVFPYTAGENGAPLLDASPLTMECTVVDVYETEAFESFILRIDHTYVEESMLTDDGKIDYRSLKPILFEMPTYEYVKTGEVLGKCLSFADKYQP